MRDLRSTELARRFEEYFDSICQGNEGDAEIKKLELSDTGILSFDVQIRHKQVAKIRLPFGGSKKVTVYSLTTHATGDVDPKNPDPSKVKFGVDTPVGKIQVNITEFLAIVATML